MRLPVRPPSRLDQRCPAQGVLQHEGRPSNPRILSARPVRRRPAAEMAALRRPPVCWSRWRGRPMLALPAACSASSSVRARPRSCPGTAGRRSGSRPRVLTILRSPRTQQPGRSRPCAERLGDGRSCTPRVERGDEISGRRTGRSRRPAWPAGMLATARRQQDRPKGDYSSGPVEDQRTDDSPAQRAACSRGGAARPCRCRFVAGGRAAAVGRRSLAVEAESRRQRVEGAVDALVAGARQLAAWACRLAVAASRMRRWSSPQPQPRRRAGVSRSVGYGVARGRRGARTRRPRQRRLAQAAACR